MLSFGSMATAKPHRILGMKPYALFISTDGKSGSGSLLSTTYYCEQEVERGVVLVLIGLGWNGSGMHHIEPHFLPDGSWIACVDGRVKCKS
jgi:hypothetical protein